MSSSKVILIGVISIVFGLYTLSLTRVESYVGSTAEDRLYISKANDNAKTGVQLSGLLIKFSCSCSSVFVSLYQAPLIAPGVRRNASLTEGVLR